MREKRRRYQPQEEDALQLGDVLEPYEQPVYQQPAYEEPAYDEQAYGQPPYEDACQDAEAYAYEEAPYPDDLQDYSDYHEEMDSKARFKVAMGVFDTVSILVGVLVILVLVGILIALVNWLRSDIMHSVLLLQSGLQ